MLDPGGLLVVVLHGVLVGRARYHFGRDLLGDDLADLVGILPIDIAELVVERLDNVAQLVQLRFRLASAATGRNRTDFGILVRKADLQAGFYLDTPAIKASILSSYTSPIPNNTEIVAGDSKCKTINKRQLSKIQILHFRAINLFFRNRQIMLYCSACISIHVIAPYVDKFMVFESCLMGPQRHSAGTREQFTDTIAIFAWCSHSQSIVNKPFLSFIFNGLYSC